MQDRNLNSCKTPSSGRAIIKAPLAMGYVPWQEFRETFDKGKAFQVGTIFPELCKPFCGRRFGS